MAILDCIGPYHLSHSSEYDWVTNLGTTNYVGPTDLWCSACYRLDYVANKHAAGTAFAYFMD